MSGVDLDREVEAQRWFAIAERDLQSAKHCLSSCPPLRESSAYHCQQACEKWLKGCLVRDGIAFPRTHDLAGLSSLVTAQHPDFSDVLSALEFITVWGVAYRYPFEEEEVDGPSLQEIGDVFILLETLSKKIGL